MTDAEMSTDNQANEQDMQPIIKKSRIDNPEMQIEVGDTGGSAESGINQTPLIGSLMAISRGMCGGTFGAAMHSPGESKVDVSEVYSPPRVTMMAKEFGLRPGDALDLTTGWDFDLASDRGRAVELLQTNPPKLLIGSPICTMFSNLQRVNRG